MQEKSLKEMLEEMQEMHSKQDAWINEMQEKYSLHDTLSKNTQDIENNKIYENYFEFADIDSLNEYFNKILKRVNDVKDLEFKGKIRFTLAVKGE